MKQITTLSQKLAGYSAIALAFAGISSSAEAQITYSGDKTSILSITDTKELDLNSDGTIDYKISGLSTSSFILAKIQNGGNWVKNPLPGYSLNITAMGFNNTIAADNPGFGAIPNMGGFLGYGFVNEGDKYVGVKFQNSTQTITYIGWLRVNVQTTNLTIKDWAYLPMADATTSMKAGEKGTATALRPRVQSAVAFSVTPTLVKETITLKTATNATYQLVNASGAVVSQGPVEAGESTISTIGLTKGIYLVKLSNQEGSAVTKIVKQ